MINSIITVDLATIEDMHQLGQSENLAIYLTILLDDLEKGSGINLLRFPEKSSPVSYGILTNVDQFANWIAPFLYKG
ncbi:hypothetical protein LT679_03655 [Mucilaginibacter roseus]|uniref:Uncharacterized protein n=1 Tax=Mucilaginibacter roseus TaxID=1528868 RepID=A0ABS8U1P6_9SPHI|nr:hypothetical protein [Mucilaginibacter roseus]MCD8739689.1 hypothetical protein [Mucilaginibacter roseus]